MPTFQSNKFRGAGDAGRFGMRYRALMNKHPFLTFGLPFMAVVIAGSFVLTPATAIRYERHDRKVRQMTKEEELGVRRSARKVDMKEEYYVRLSLLFPFCCFPVLLVLPACLPVCLPAFLPSPLLARGFGWRTGRGE